mmetsp:Transcript_22772/g.65644  ORF Transcript_22772/g.65644 Transcript_22772/m.65644 type:complete len:265 (+) Transcript_22772:2451-3245(+)
MVRSFWKRATASAVEIMPSSSSPSASSPPSRSTSPSSRPSLTIESPPPTEAVLSVSVPTLSVSASDGSSSLSSSETLFSSAIAGASFPVSLSFSSELSSVDASSPSALLVPVVAQSSFSFFSSSALCPSSSATLSSPVTSSVFSASSSVASSSDSVSSAKHGVLPSLVGMGLPPPSVTLLCCPGCGFSDRSSVSSSRRDGSSIIRSSAWNDSIRALPILGAVDPRGLGCGSPVPISVLAGDASWPTRDASFHSFWDVRTSTRYS